MLLALPLETWPLTVRYTTLMHAPNRDINDVTCTADNKLLIVKLGGLEPLIRQMLSPNVEVQCNAVGCVTNLATHGKSSPYRW